MLINIQILYQVMNDINQNHYKKSPSQVFSNYDNINDIQESIENCTYQRTSTPIPPSTSSLIPTIKEDPDDSYSVFSNNLQNAPKSFQVRGVNRILLGVIAGNLTSTPLSNTRKKIEIRKAEHNVNPKNGFILFMKKQLIRTRIFEGKKPKAV